VAGDRTARVWAWISAAHEGGSPVSLAALCRAAAGQLAVDGASVTALGPGLREPLWATDELSARLDELLLTTGEGPGADDFMFGSPMLIPDLEPVTERWPGFAPACSGNANRARARSRPSSWRTRWSSPISRCSCCLTRPRASSERLITSR
jgi:hypothetical protein